MDDYAIAGTDGQATGKEYLTTAYKDRMHSQWVQIFDLKNKGSAEDKASGRRVIITWNFADTKTFAARMENAVTVGEVCNDD